MFSPKASLTPEILVVDDEPLIRWAVTTRLKDEGYQIWEADSCATALQVFNDRRQVGVVILDLRLPDGDGISVLKAIKSAPDRETVVIIRTASTSIDTAVECLKLGAADYFYGPVNLDELSIRVAQALSRIAVRRAAASAAGTLFISYAREDQPKAIELYRQLKAANFSPWLDHFDLVAGQEWQPTITNAIRQSRFFLACLSRRAVNKRGTIQAEIREALDVAKTIPSSGTYLIPVRLDDCVLPDDLARYQWVDIFKHDGWDKLTRAIHQGMTA